MKLFGVQLDDRLLADRHIDLLTIRIPGHFAGKIGGVRFQPRGDAQCAVILRQFLEESVGTALFRNRDHVALIYQRGRDVEALAVLKMDDQIREKLDSKIENTDSKIKIFDRL